MAAASSPYRKSRRREEVIMTQHEICTPLTVIKGYISLIREGNYGKIPGQVKQILSLVEDSANNLVVTVRNSLDKRKK